MKEDDFIYYNGIYWKYSKTEKNNKIYVREEKNTEFIIEDASGKIEIQNGRRFTLVKGSKKWEEGLFFKT